jgi:hypothetical protein
MRQQYPLSLCLDRLVSGGLITNYVCSSSCAHCVYRSSPARDRAYITAAQAEACFGRARSLGCSAMHIGGGEPFLDIAGLKEALRAARRSGMFIDYIETNASWYRDADSASCLLEELQSLGCGTLLLSIDPFHNEHIPFRKVKGVMAACRRTGMGIFPWRMEFYDEIDPFDDHVTHGLEEYVEAYGERYLRDLMHRYSVSHGGRALRTFDRMHRQRSAADWLADSAPCRTLANTTHFHIDLYGTYIPSGCPGMAVAIEDLGAPLEPVRYPALTTLYTGGVAALHDRARELGYRPARDTYGTECALCDEIRGWLAHSHRDAFPDLAPLEFYAENREP